MDKSLAIVLRAVGATQTARDVGRVDSSISGLTKRAGTFATTLKTSVSGAVSTFGGRIKQLIGVGAGFLGVGGLLGLGAVLKDSISKAQAWGEASLRLAQITKLPIEMTSKLIDALDYFGVSAEQQLNVAAKYEKALGGIAEFSAKGAKTVAEWNKTHAKHLTITQQLALEYPKLVAFQKQFGLQLVDSKGHLLDYNAQLLVSADYFNNKAIPASTKALALSKLYGKSWTDLIPILAQGRAGILKAEQGAMHMSQKDLDALTANKEATRKWTDTLGDLETQIGIKLLPTLTEMLSGVTGFVNQHTDEIIEFVQKAVAVGKTAVSTIAGVAEELGGLWNAIPAPLRDFLVKFTLGERVLKFLFGFNIVEVAGKIVEKAGVGVVEGIAGGLAKAGIGKAFVQPVFVTNQGFGGGGPGGLLGGAAGAAEGAGAAAGAAAGGISLAIPAIAAAVFLAVPLAMTAAGYTAKYGPGRRSAFGPSGVTAPGGSTPIVQHTGALSVEDRTLREPLIAAASKLQNIKDASQTTASQAKRNAANAKADQQSLRTALAYRLDMANSRLEAIKDKSQAAIKVVINPGAVNIKIAGQRVVRSTTSGYAYSVGGGKYES